MTAAVAGCGLVQKNEDKDRAIVVAEVNGTKILKGALIDEFERAKKAYQGGIPEEQEQQVRETILESLIEQEIILQKAKAAGFEVNDDIRKEAEEAYQKEVLDYARALQEEAKEKEEEATEDPTGGEDNENSENNDDKAGEETPDATANNDASETKNDDSEEKTAGDENNDNNASGESDKDGQATGEDTENKDDQETAGDANDETPVEQKFIDQAEEEIEEWLKYMNYTVETYIERIAQSLVMQDFMEEQTKDIVVDDKEVEEYYDSNLEIQKSNPMLIDYGYFPVRIVKTPASRTVKHILIKLSDEDSKEISKLRSDGKKDEAENLLEEKLEDIKPKAQEVLEKAKAGEDFEELIKEYNEDPGMEDEDYKDGYEFTRDGSFVQSFKDASFEMKEGEISDLVASDYGYHIIKVYKAVEDEILPLEDVKEEIEDTVRKEKQDKEWVKKVEEWVEKATIKKHTNRLK